VGDWALVPRRWTGVAPAAATSTVDLREGRFTRFPLSRPMGEPSLGGTAGGIIKGGAMTLSFGFSFALPFGPEKGPNGPL